MRVLEVVLLLAGAVAAVAGLAVSGLLWLSVVGLVLLVLGAAVLLLGALVPRS